TAGWSWIPPTDPAAKAVRTPGQPRYPQAAGVPAPAVTTSAFAATVARRAHSRAAGTRRRPGPDFPDFRRLSRYDRVEFAEQAVGDVFGIAEQHEGLVLEVEFVFHAGEAGVHAAFDDHDGTSSGDIEHGHAVDGAVPVGFRRRVGNVVGADHQGHVALGEV